MEQWQEFTLKTMEEQLSGLREKDLRFFRIDELRRNIRRLSEYHSSCQGCRELKMEVDGILSHMNEAISVPGPRRRELDRVVVRLSRHMMKVHGFYPPWHFTYLHSFYGIVSGLLVSLVLTAAIPALSWEFLAAGFIAGLIAGQLTGSRKDRDIRARNKLM